VAEYSYDNIDPLLVKVVLEEASTEELVQVREWVAQSDANGKYFEDFKQIWAESKHLAMRSTLDEEDAWQEFQRRVQDTPVIPMTPRRQLRWVGVAAALMILLGGGWFYYYGNKPEGFLAVRSGNQVLTDTLPEGSVVTLNKESLIKYKRHFAGDTRGIEMEGEAFFAVTPDKAKPFVVQAGGASVTVLGTSFNVKTMKDSTEVIVETGMVEVKKGSSRLDVHAHERAIISKDGAVLIKAVNPDRLYNYYRTNAFECNGTPLWRLVAKLNEVYKAHIDIDNPRLKDIKISTTFPENMTLTQILDVIKATFEKQNLTITTKSDGDIIIQ
jgi:transmembrane sensor